MREFNIYISFQKGTKRDKIFDLQNKVSILYQRHLFLKIKICETHFLIVKHCYNFTRVNHNMKLEAVKAITWGKRIFHLLMSNVFSSRRPFPMRFSFAQRAQKRVFFSCLLTSPVYTSMEDFSTLVSTVLVSRIIHRVHLSISLISLSLPPFMIQSDLTSRPEG